MEAAWSCDSENLQKVTYGADHSSQSLTCVASDADFNGNDVDVSEEFEHVTTQRSLSPPPGRPADNQPPDGSTGDCVSANNNGMSQPDGADSGAEDLENDIVAEAPPDGPIGDLSANSPDTFETEADHVDQTETAFEENVERLF